MTSRYAEPFQTAFDNSGVIIPGATLETYEADTSNPVSVFSDADLTIPHANPVVADASGRFPDIFLRDDQLYKFVLKDADGVLIRTSDFYGTGSRVIDETKGDDIPSANNIDLAVATGNFVDITGNTDIVSLGSVAAGAQRVLRFLGELTIVHNNISLILPGGADIKTQVNDIMYVRSLGGGNWIASSYERSNGGVIDLVTAKEGELTIAAGEITITGSRHTVDTEGEVAADDLDTINGSADGKYLTLSIEDDSRDVTIKHNTGNIVLTGAADVILDKVSDTILLQYDATQDKWLEISESLETSRPIPGSTVLPTTEYFTSSGTFNVPATITEVEVELVGGGGAGSSETPLAGGGGAGGYATKKVTTTPGSNITVTVGSGGNIILFNPGEAGGSSSFGAFVSATGGQGGGISGGQGGIGINGDININGGQGGPGGTDPGLGGASYFGGQGAKGSGGRGFTGGTSGLVIVRYFE